MPSVTSRRAVISINAAWYPFSDKLAADVRNGSQIFRRSELVARKPCSPPNQPSNVVQVRRRSDDFPAQKRKKIPCKCRQRLVQDSEPVSATIQGGVVLLSVRAGAYFKLNRVGAEIWNMLTEPRRAGEIIDVLAQNYGADNGTVSRDVTPFLAMLIQHQLLLVIDPDVIR